MRWHALEEWICEHRTWPPPRLAKRDVAWLRRHGPTLAVASVASSKAQFSLDLPNEADWLEVQMKPLATLAIEWFDQMNTLEAAKNLLLGKPDWLDLLSGSRFVDEHIVMQQVALLWWDGRADEVRRLVDAILAPSPLASDNLIDFARHCTKDLHV
jgi:hypothetical protein